MKLKKLAALFLAGILTLSLAACGSATQDTSSKSDSEVSAEGSDTKEQVESNGDELLSGKLVIWTLAADLEQFADHFMEQHKDVNIEVVNIAPADYVTKVSTALRGKSAVPDIIVGEPQMLPNLFEAGYFEDLSQEPYNADQYKDKIFDYIYEAGKDAEGKLRALSYQVTPGGIIYRRDIAQKIWNNEEPEFIAEKFKDYDTILQTAEEVKAAGYRIFNSTGDLRWYSNGGEAWVKDGVLNMSEERMKYFDTAVALYEKKLIAFAPEWSAAWFGSMAGEIPMNAEWQELTEMDASAEKTEVLAYSLPSWGALVVRDNAAENTGKFGVTSGPCAYFGGGTFLGINTYSKQKQLAWEYVKFVTLNEETARWWTEVSNGDVVSMKSVLEENIEKENAGFGNQKTYAYYLNEAENIDYSTVTKYDDQMISSFGAAIESVQSGIKTKEQALKDFYVEVNTYYPEIQVPQ